MTTIKTIIVDDESRIRRGLERQVYSCGEEWEIIGSFSDGKEAYEAITENDIQFDFLITDVRMPEMDGLTLLNKLNHNHTFVSIIISGYDDFEYLQKAMREGSTNYILKPVDRSQFREQLNQVKMKVLAKREEEQRWKATQKKAAQLTYTKQIQWLSEVTWSDEIDLPPGDWSGKFPTGSYKLIYIGIDQFLSLTKKTEQAEWESWHRKIENVYEQIYIYGLKELKLKSWWWRTGKLNFWLLLCSEDGQEGFLHAGLSNLVGQLKSGIQQSTPFTVSAAVSNNFEQLIHLPAVKKQLVSLMQLRITQGGNKIFYVDSEDGQAAALSKGINPTIYKCTQQILSTMEQESDQETNKVLTLFFHELEAMESPILIEEAVNFLYVRIIDRWIEFEGFTDAPHLLIEALQLAKHAGNFTQLKDGIKLWVLKVKQGIASLKRMDSDPVQRAKVWINHHLGENITIKKIADHVYMSPTYFSNFFKAQTGETVLDYVTKCRLEKAKELLETTELKIYDISDQLGYQDTKYFSRLFKQWQGQSPSQYRENYHRLHSDSSDCF